MKTILSITWITSLLALSLVVSCEQRQTEETNSQHQQTSKEVTANDILGNPEYLAISYGGYRHESRDIQPTLEELKDDMKILQAQGIRVLRTYNVHLPHASNLLRAIREMKIEDDSFEMYVMLGAWIDCASAFTPHPNHEAEDAEKNAAEIETAVELANMYHDIVKVIAVGNEAMVHWASSYFVRPGVILKWVEHLQELKQTGELPADLWITSSDDYASWGGGDSAYHVPDLEKLIRAVDFVSMHTYPYHNTHYNPKFWGVHEDESGLSAVGQIEAAMERAVKFARFQYRTVQAYVHGIAPGKPVHIGETGWATVSSGYYGKNGSRASDELKAALYYRSIRDWTNKSGISCFYFEAFDEPWKDGHNPKGSENHFGLMTVDGKAKHVLWDMVDNGVFDGLTRNGKPIVKTYGGDMNSLLKDVPMPPVKSDLLVGRK